MEGANSNCNVGSKSLEEENGGLVLTEIREFVRDLHIQKNSEEEEEENDLIETTTIHDDDHITVAVGKEKRKLGADRNMDKKKKSKLVMSMGMVEEDVGKEFLHINMRDEFGRLLTPKEAFRKIMNKFKIGGKVLQEEKRMKREFKLKQIRNSSSFTPSLSVERMREAQARLKTPYLVLVLNYDGDVK